MNSKNVGNISELSCILAFMKLGYAVSIPFGDCERYDFVVDINNKLYRIQVKTSNTNHLEEGYISFRCDNTTTSKGKVVHHTYTSDEIDYFATFYNEKCYLIPVEECSREKRLRFSPPKNGQTQGITFAKDYELEEVLKTL